MASKSLLNVLSVDISSDLSADNVLHLIRKCILSSIMTVLQRISLIGHQWRQIILKVGKGEKVHLCVTSVRAQRA